MYATITLHSRYIGIKCPEGIIYEYIPIEVTTFDTLFDLQAVVNYVRYMYATVTLHSRYIEIKP